MCSNASGIWDHESQFTESEAPAQAEETPLAEFCTVSRSEQKRAREEGGDSVREEPSADLQLHATNSQVEVNAPAMSPGPPARVPTSSPRRSPVRVETGDEQVMVAFEPTFKILRNMERDEAVQEIQKLLSDLHGLA